jgi:hypothetical protein
MRPNDAPGVRTAAVPFPGAANVPSRSDVEPVFGSTFPIGSAGDRSMRGALGCVRRPPRPPGSRTDVQTRGRRISLTR